MYRERERESKLSLSIVRLNSCICLKKVKIESLQENRSVESEKVFSISIRVSNHSNVRYSLKNIISNLTLVEARIVGCGSREIGTIDFHFLRHEDDDRPATLIHRELSFVTGIATRLAGSWDSSNENRTLIVTVRSFARLISKASSTSVPQSSITRENDVG